MKRLIFFYGLLSGLIVIVTNTVSMELGYGHVWLGFLVMFIAFSCIYVAIRQYRDQTLGGLISFPKALLLGLGISAIAALVYVLVWELYLALTDYSFVERYAQSMIQAKQAAGADDAQIAKVTQEAAQFARNYSNPLFRMPMTALEIFPVGLLISLISALVLRNHKHIRTNQKDSK